jgi:hypothetical protein
MERPTLARAAKVRSSETPKFAALLRQLETPPSPVECKPPASTGKYEKLSGALSPRDQQQIDILSDFAASP